MASTTSSLSLLARRMVLTAARRSRLSPSVALAVKLAFSTQSTKNVQETLAYKPDPNDTHMHDQFRHLETMLEKNLEYHSRNQLAVAELKELLEHSTHTGMAVDAPDGENDGHIAEEMAAIQAIFDDVAAHKTEINARLTKVKQMMQENQKTFAVDAPDGESDAHVREELEEVKHIIEDAAKHEDSAKIKYQHVMDKEIRKERAKDPEHDW